MKGLVITTANEMFATDFADPVWKSLGAFFDDGLFEIVHPQGLSRPYCMVVDEEGLLRELPLNTLGCLLYGTFEHGQPIVGNIIIAKEGVVDGDIDFISLDETEILRLSDRIVRMTAGRVKWADGGGKS